MELIIQLYFFFNISSIVVVKDLLVFIKKKNKWNIRNVESTMDIFMQFSNAAAYSHAFNINLKCIESYNFKQIKQVYTRYMSLLQIP